MADLDVSPPKLGIKGRALRSHFPNSTMTRIRKRCDTATPAEVIGTIEDGDVIHAVSMADWQAHEMIEHIAAQLAPCDLYVSSWAISEETIAVLLRLIEAGTIRKVFALFDWRVQQYTPAEAAFARQHFTARFVENHSKVCVWLSDDRGVVSTGSANLTGNPRIEAQVITADLELARWYAEWIAHPKVGKAIKDTRSRRMQAAAAALGDDLGGADGEA